MKVAILGAGHIAEKMASAINGLDDSVSAYAVASRSLEKAQAFADKFGFQKAYGSYEEMLDDPEVDLVYVATPHSHHFKHAMMCIDAGKPVLCEKSFTANAEMARKLINHAEEKGVFITEAIWTRYMPSRKIIDEVIASGAIGEVKMIMADLSYNIVTKGRMLDPNLAGGSLLDLGVYPINFAAMFMGNDILDISGTCTYTETSVDCQESIAITYKDGRFANLTASMMVQSNRMGHICGTKGFIDCVNINNIEKILVYNADYKLLQEIQVPQQINGYEYEVLACQKALAEGKLFCEEMPHEETIRIMEWMDKLRADWDIKFPFEE